MKLPFLVLLLTLTFSTGLSQEKTYTLKESQLTESQKVQVKSETVSTQTTGWIGFGKEVGTAMKEGLSALNDEVNKFSQTDAGHFTMFVIAYKVMGKDILHAVFGIGFTAIFFIMFSFFYYRNCVVRRIVIEKSGPWNAKVKRYSVVNQLSDEQNVSRAIHAVIFIVVLIIMIMVTFISG
jgi:hypothetical protein